MGGFAALYVEAMAWAKFGMTPKQPPLVNAAVPRQFPVALREIRIDQALRRAARCGRCALRQRSKAALDIAAVNTVGLQANRVAWIIGLRAHGRGDQRRCNRQNRASQYAHGGSLGTDEQDIEI